MFLGITFHPEIMGGFFVARAISDSFAKAQPGYSFKQATLDPVNSANLADVQETSIINAFNSNPQLSLQKGIIKINFLYILQWKVSILMANDINGNRMK